MFLFLSPPSPPRLSLSYTYMYVYIQAVETEMSDNNGTGLGAHQHHSHADAHLTFNPPESLRQSAHVKSFQEYQQLYEQSVSDPETFWSGIAEQFYWESKPDGPFLNFNFDIRKGPIFIKWMEGAKTNICYNMLDRHVKNGLGNKIAFYW